MLMNKYLKFNKLALIVIVIFTLFFLSACMNSSFNIIFGKKKIEMYVGESIVLTTNIENNDKVEWKSLDEEIATVSDDGEVVALKKGNTVIEAIYESQLSEIFIIVKEAPIKREITITGPQMVLIDKEIELHANIDLKEDESIIWESSDNTVATVEDGIVKGVLTGLVTIKATLSTDPSIYSSLCVLVRTGSGVQDVIINKIYNETYEFVGTTDLTHLSEKIVSTVEKTKDAIVGVSNYQASSTSLKLSGVGSGVIIKKEVLESGKYLYTLLSNYHVVENAKQLKVYIGNDVDKEFEATLINKNQNDDLAVLTFEYDKEITPIEFASETQTKVGEFVLAIGNPTGYDFYNSVTFGITSYVNRKVEGESASFIQHDASINPGNSGGALLNLDGKLIGINTLKIAKLSVEGMGFAVDLQTINKLFK